MSRPLLILLVILAAIVLGMVALANMDTEVALQPVSKPMLNEAQPK